MEPLVPIPFLVEDILFHAFDFPLQVLERLAQVLTGPVEWSPFFLVVFRFLVVCAVSRFQWEEQRDQCVDHDSGKNAGHDNRNCGDRTENIDREVSPIGNPLANAKYLTPSGPVQSFGSHIHPSYSLLLCLLRRMISRFSIRLARSIIPSSNSLSLCRRSFSFWVEAPRFRSFARMLALMTHAANKNGATIAMIATKLSLFIISLPPDARHSVFLRVFAQLFELRFDIIQFLEVRELGIQVGPGSSHACAGFHAIN